MRSHQVVANTLLGPALVALAATGCFLRGGGFPAPPVVTDDHRARIIAATADAEADIGRARNLLREERVVDALNLLLDRIKTLQTLLYDEYLLRSQAYDSMDLPTAREYGVFIRELQRAETAALMWLNEPLNIILNKILLANPDPRRREEAVDAINGGANEVFIQFKTGYREEIVRSLRVRLRSEHHVGVRVKMNAVLGKLSLVAAHEETTAPGTVRGTAGPTR